MKKAAARAKGTGVTDDTALNRDGWLSLDPVPLLSQHLEVLLTRASPARGKAWTRRTLSKLALEIIIVSLGFRRAVLIDTFSPSVSECIVIASGLRSFSLSPASEAASELSKALRNRVAVLYHGPTGQAFLVNRSQHMWADRPSMPRHNVGSSEPTERLWIDARRSGIKSDPHLTSPSSHVQELIDTVHDAVVVSEPNPTNCFLIESTAITGSDGLYSSNGERTTQQVLVGTALAGWLLEYGGVYCLETPVVASLPDSRVQYNVRSIDQARRKDTVATDTWADLDVDSMTNCLGSQPLLLFRVLLCSSVGKLELLAFSVPEVLLTCAQYHLGQTLQNTFEQRLLAVPPISALTQHLALSSIQVEVTRVCLDRVAL